MTPEGQRHKLAFIQGPMLTLAFQILSAALKGIPEGEAERRAQARKALTALRKALRPPKPKA